MNRYYITTQGLAEGAKNADLLQTLKGILLGRVHHKTTQAFERKGLIARDKRTSPHVDHNLLILSGAIERLQSAVMPPPAETAASNNHPVGRQPVRYVPQEAPKPKLSPVVQKVYAAFQRTGAATVSELTAQDKDMKEMNHATLRWAIQQLRSAGLLATAQSAAA